MLKGSFNRLLASIQTVKGVGPATAKKLRARQITTLEDALFFLPVRYQDRRDVTAIADLVPETEAVVSGRIVGVKRAGGRRQQRLHLTVADETGRLTATWFHFNPAAGANLVQGAEVILAGRVDEYKGRACLLHPEIVPADDAAGLGRFVPIYRNIPGLSSKVFRRFVKSIIDDELGRLESPLPARLIEEEGLLELKEAFGRVHFPEDEEDVSPSGPPRRTLNFTELFLFQVCLAKARRERSERRAEPLTAFDEVRRQVTRALPFELTAAQRRVLDELGRDLTGSRPMNRLLQGDVGAGKTVLAAVALLAAGRSGLQAALMAPTELLAGQHYNNIKPWADEAGVRLGLLTGSVTGRKRREALHGLADGRLQVVIGTHALFQEAVAFARLGLVVVDEQHRFGVAQRAALGDKGLNPHRLVMTATPIPRSLALTLYGDLDVSVLDEKPPGRRQVITRLLPPQRIQRAWQAISGAVSQGLQAYVVLPTIEPGEGLASAEERFAELKRDILPDLKLALLHGRMDKDAQAAVMSEFVAGRIDVLVATTVVEVGLDAPKAAVMVIENAERFGLAQIHQLRGRVGRGGTTAACLLISAGDGRARQRLKMLEQSDDGFAIAETDLAFRGPGDFLGERQTGWPDFRLANLLTDSRLLLKARRAAFDLIEHDPELADPEHRVLKEIVHARLVSRLKLSGVG